MERSGLRKSYGRELKRKEGKKKKKKCGYMCGGEIKRGKKKKKRKETPRVWREKKNAITIFSQ